MIQALITLAVVGFIVWLIVTAIPMPNVFKQIIIGVAALWAIMWLLRAVGIISGLGLPTFHGW